MTVRLLRRVESWTDWKAAGGTREYVVDNVLACKSNTTLLSDRLSLVLAIGNPALEYLLTRTVIRLDESDSVYDEWKIVDRSTDEQQGIVTINAASLRSTDFSEAAVIERDDSDGVVVFDFESLGLPPAEHIAQWVLPALAAAGITWIGIGTIDPIAPIDLTFEWDTPLAALLHIADVTSCELDLRRNGDIGYLIDLVSKINEVSQRADLRVDKNLVNITADEDTIDQATRVYPRGSTTDDGSATMSRALWIVDAVALNVVTLADPAGGSGPLQFDDQLNGFYLRKADGTLTQVTACNAAAQEVTVADATGMAVGDLIQFRFDSTGKDLTFLEDPFARADFGVKASIKDLPDTPGTNNLITNPFLRDWLGALPAGWSSVGSPTITKQTAAPYTALGGASLKVEGAASGDGVVTDARALFVSLEHPYVSGYARIWVASGSVRVELVLTTPDGERTLPVAAVASNSVLGQWEDLGVSGIDAIELAATAAAIRIVQNGTTPAVFYVDAGQLTESPSQEPLVEGSGGTILWQAANEILRTSSLPKVQYTVPLVDLEQLDPVKWAESALVIGAPARVRSPRLAVDVLTRILEVNRDYLEARATSVVLSNKFADLTDFLAAFHRRGRKSPTTTEPGPTDESLLSVAIEDLSETTTEHTYLVIKGAAVDQVWLGVVEFDSPLPASPWETVAAATEPMPAGQDTFTVRRPSGKRVTLIQVEPRAADLTITGEVQRATLKAAPPQLPAIETAYSESATTGTGFAALRGRGEVLVTVQVQTKSGRGTLSAWSTPLRKQGDFSYAKQRTLAVNEYEHDVLKDQDRPSTMQFRGIVEGTGEVISTDVMSFDWNTTPDILFADGDGSIATVIGDSDTKSVRLQRTGSTWEFWSDGPSVKVDVQLTTGNGSSGSQAPMGAGETWPITATAYSKPRAEVALTPGTAATDTASLIVKGSTSVVPKWEYVNVAAPEIGSVNVPIVLDADSSSGLTARVKAAYNPGNGFVELGDITAALAPSLSAPPIASTTYIWSGLPSTYQRTSTGIQIELKLTAEILSGGSVVATVTRSAIWYYGQSTVDPNPPTGGPDPDPGTEEFIPDPSWDSVTLTRPSVGSRDVAITLDATRAEGTVELLTRIDDGYGWSLPFDIAGSVTPALSAPPTAATVYTWAMTTPTDYTRTVSGKPVIVEITANIKKSGVVVATQKKSVSWLYTDDRI